MSHNYYKILGVEITATDKEIRSSYQKMVSKAHPDRGGNDAEFAEIRKAYEVLSDPGRREEYDRTGASKSEFSLTESAKSVAVSMFINSIASSISIGENPLNLCRRQLVQQLDMTTSEIESSRKEKLDVEEVLRNMVSKSGSDLLLIAIQSIINKAEGALQRLDEKEKVLKLAIDIVDEYDCKMVSVNPFVHKFNPLDSVMFKQTNGPANWARDIEDKGPWRKTP